jgi:hypothetical protein
MSVLQGGPILASVCIVALDATANAIALISGELGSFFHSENR